MTIAGLALALGGGASFAAEGIFGNDKDGRGQLSERDYRFVKDAARGGTSEVELANWPSRKAPAKRSKTSATAW